MDGTDDDMLWNGSEEDGVVRSECKEDEGTDCEDGDSDTGWWMLQVLRPQSALPSLEVWQYYLGEQLAHGPNYDLEVIQLDSQQEEEAEAADGIVNKSARRVVAAGWVVVHWIVLYLGIMCKNTRVLSV